MRNHPIEATSWESEAARRREVIESDFGAPHAHHQPDRGPRSEIEGGQLRRLATWFTTVVRRDGQVANGRVDHDPGCQPGMHAVRPGS
jgi:hypothetical protein